MFPSSYILHEDILLKSFMSYNNFSLLQKLVVAANHPNCGTVRTVGRVAVFAGSDKETQVWKSQNTKNRPSNPLLAVHTKKQNIFNSQ